MKLAPLISGMVAIAALTTGPLHGRNYYSAQLPRLKTLCNTAKKTSNQRKIRKARRQRHANGDKKAFC